MKKGIALLLTIGLLLCCATALAKSYSPIWIGDVKLEDGQYILTTNTTPQTGKPTSNLRYAYYENGKLTLRNYNNMYLAYNQNLQHSAAVYAMDDLVVIAYGENRLAGYGRGIVVDKKMGELTLSGTGKLYIEPYSGSENSTGLLAEGDISINALTLNIDVRTRDRGISSTYGQVMIQNDADVTVDAGGEAVYSCEKFVMKSGTLHATSSTADAIWGHVDGIDIQGGRIYAKSKTPGDKWRKAIARHITDELKLADGLIMRGRKDSESGELELITSTDFETLRDKDYIEIYKDDRYYFVNVSGGTVNKVVGNPADEAATNYYQMDTSVCVRADVPAGYEFVEWSGSGIPTLTAGTLNSSEIQFKMPQDDVYLIADIRLMPVHVCSGHLWSGDASQHWKSCPECGDEAPESRSVHTYESGLCVCGAIERKETEPEKAERPYYPIKIIKVLAGVSAEDLPDGTEFIFDIYDMTDLNGGPVGEVRFGKEMLEAGRACIDTHVPREFGMVERHPGSKGIFDLDIDYKMEGPLGELADAMTGGGEGSTPVGGFIITEIVNDPNRPNLPVNPYKRDAFELVLPELVITNNLTLRPMDMPQTGDESDIVLWLSLALTSMAALSLIARKKREI